MKKYKNKKRGFTIVELVIVIAVIAVLAAVLIPTFSGIVDKANRSSALQEARVAWNEVSYTYVSGYDGFAADCGELNGWYYDYVDDVAKYDVGEKYTVCYDGETFTVNDYDEDAWSWGAITTASADYTTYDVSAKPSCIGITYYTNIYSRGFAWMTDTSNDESKLYIVKSNLGSDADFDSATAITGTCEEVKYTGGNGNAYSGVVYNGETITGSGTAISDFTYNSHKAYITGLSASTTYSYKIGGDGNWSYGVFRTASTDINSITAIQVSDAQTLNPGQLNVWENTLAQAVETAGHSLDFIIHNGDQFDQRMWSSDNSNVASSISRIMRYGLAIDTVSKYVTSIPYMTSSGNHEPFAPYSQVLTSTIDYGVDGVSGDGIDKTGGYYSYDYGFAHFVVLNTNLTGTDLAAEKAWLESDLAAASSAKWKIVTMHIGCYATGDHSNGTQVQNLITTFTPVFSQYHVDLVLQAHDHTYSKTLPYKWDAAGWTKTYNNNDVVNFNVQTTTYNGVTYDLNPNGTYYVTTGAAGHRAGESEKNDGCWADVVGTGTSSQLTPLTSSKSFLNNTYKIEVGKITRDNDYTDIVVSGVTNDEHYEVGDPATGNVNAQMFGILNLTEDTLTYDFYTVEGNTVKLFDSLNIMKK